MTQQTTKLFDSGCLVNLKIGTWSGRKMLTRSDLMAMGYNPDNLPEEIVNLGRKLMVPKGEIQAITKLEQRARKILEKNSVPFGISGAKFVPIKLLSTVEAQFAELKDEFFAKVDSFIGRFGDMVQAAKDFHPAFWERCLKKHYPADPKALREKFQFGWFIFTISGSSDLTQTTTEQAVQDDSLRKQRQEAMAKALQEEAKNFAQEYVDLMRTKTIEFCDHMAARINGTPYGDEESAKKMTARSIACFRKQITHFRDMNIFDDAEIEKSLVEFQKTFLDHGVTAETFKSGNIKSAVLQALDAIKSKAGTALGTSPSRKVVL